jgi:hypothetical protein
MLKYLLKNMLPRQRTSIFLGLISREAIHLRKSIRGEKPKKTGLREGGDIGKVC